MKRKFHLLEEEASVHDEEEEEESLKEVESINLNFPPLRRPPQQASPWLRDYLNEMRDNIVFIQQAVRSLKGSVKQPESKLILIYCSY